MANVKLIFQGSNDSLTNKTEMQCYANDSKNIYIDIKEENGYHPSFICLDVSTAIKLAKTLRTQINLIKSIS